MDNQHRKGKLAGEKAAAGKAEIFYLLKKGICPLFSYYYSRLFDLHLVYGIHLVSEKNGGWRLCRDYRKSNSITVPDRYSPPLIHDLFPILHEEKIFSTIDLENAYYQIPMFSDDIEKTAITTLWGVFETLSCHSILKTQGRPFNVLWTQFFDKFIMLMSM